MEAEARFPRGLQEVSNNPNHVSRTVVCPIHHLRVLEPALASRFLALVTFRQVRLAFDLLLTAD